MIKALVFDCFGVLTTDTWRAFVDGLPEDIDKSRLHELNRQLDVGVLSHDDFKQQVFELTGSQPVEVERLLNNETVKNEALLNIIREQRQKGIKIGMISNVSTDWITESFLSDQEQALFDSMILSHQVRLIKPDPKIFELACQKLGVDTSEAVMIDDVERYCQAAEQTGMKSIVYTDLAKFKNDLGRLTADSDN